MDHCKNASKFKGYVMPRCNHGQGCDACWAVYFLRQNYRNRVQLQVAGVVSHLIDNPQSRKTSRELVDGGRTLDGGLFVQIKPFAREATKKVVK